MSAYVIARVNVTDWEKYKEYAKASPGAIAEFGGKFIARGGEMITLEGPEETSRVVIVEFPSFEQAKAFYYSDTYQAAIKLREGAAEGQFILVEGL